MRLHHPSISSMISIELSPLNIIHNDCYVSVGFQFPIEGKPNRFYSDSHTTDLYIQFPTVNRYLQIIQHQVDHKPSIPQLN